MVTVMGRQSLGQGQNYEPLKTNVMAAQKSACHCTKECEKAREPFGARGNPTGLVATYGTTGTQANVRSVATAER